PADAETFVGMSNRLAKLTTNAALDRSASFLIARLAELEDRLGRGDDATWAAYTDTVKVLVALAANMDPERRGEFLTTAEMARRLSITPKGLLRRKARGQIRPALQAGKFIRWKGSETG